MYDAGGVAAAQPPLAGVPQRKTLSMFRSRAKSPLLAAVQGLAVLATLTLTGCPNGDVGAPCNHGTVTPPSSFLVTFPALSCNDLLCVYADTNKPEVEACVDDAQCNEGQDQPRFECSGGQCRLLPGFSGARASVTANF